MNGQINMMGNQTLRWNDRESLQNDAGLSGEGVIVPRGQNNILHRRQTWSSTSVSLVNFEQVTSLSFS